LYDPIVRAIPAASRASLHVQKKEHPLTCYEMSSPYDLLSSLISILKKVED